MTLKKQLDGLLGLVLIVMLPVGFGGILKLLWRLFLYGWSTL